MTGGPSRRGLLVLAYHAISPSWDDPLSVTPEMFGAQVEVLAARGYRGVTFSEAARPGRGRRVAITFDDAFGSAARYGRVILDDAGWPATVFVPTVPASTGEPMRWLGNGSRSPESHPELVAMTWEEISGLALAGWEIGSHSRTHRLLSALPSAEADDELARSREEILAHVDRCDAISYPWGEVEQGVVDRARRAGYTSGSGLAGRFRFGDPMAVPRFAVAHADDTGSRFRIKTSPAVWLARSTPAWSALERFRTASSPAASAERGVG